MGASRLKTIGTLLALLPLWVAAQDSADVATVLPVSAAKQTLDLTPHLQLFEDPSTRLGIEDVSAPERAADFSAVNESANFGFSASAWWVRFSFRNDGDSDQVLLLRQAYPLIDHLDLWYRDSGSPQEWIHRATGDRLPFAARDVDQRDFVFPTQVPAGATVDYFLRFQSGGATDIVLTASQHEAMLETVSAEQLAYGIYYGGFVVLVLYNLLMWIIVKDKAFLYYLLYVSSYGIYFAINNGLAYQYFWPTNSWWANQSLVVMLALTLFFGLHFTRVFLQLRRSAPRLNSVAIYLQGLLAVVLVVGMFLPYRTIIIPLSALTIVVVSHIILSGTVTLLKGFGPARYFMLAWGALLIGVMAYMFKTFGLLPSNFFTEHGQQIGSLIEMVLLSLGLASRVDELQRQSLTDPLTSLANRRFFDDKLLTEFEHAHGQGTGLAMLMIDIDHFKNFNDRFGHAWGDEALKMVASVLQENVRRSDHVCRYGGEEFAVILPSTDTATAIELADLLRTRVAAADVRGEHLSISLGLVSLQDDAFSTAASFFDAADRALYKAKSDGRNRVVSYTPGLVKRHGRRATDLANART